MEEGNGSPQERMTPRRQLSPSTWLVLLMFILLMRANYANDGQSDEMGMCAHSISRGQTHDLIRTVDTQPAVRTL